MITQDFDKLIVAAETSCLQVSEGILRFGLDAEWDSQERFLCAQIATTNAVIVVWFPAALEHQSRETLAAITVKQGGEPWFMDEGDSILDRLLGRYESLKVLQTHMFYSSMDLEAFLGEDAWGRLLESPLIKQGRRITVGVKGSFQKGVVYRAGQWFESQKSCRANTGEEGIRFELDDLKGNSVGGLGAMAESVGHKMNKDILDDSGKPYDKGDMGLVLRERPMEFTKYAIDDARDLLHIRDAFQSKISEIAIDLLGVAIDPKKVPGTNGALVAKLFEMWVMEQHPGLRAAFVRLGVDCLSLRGKTLQEQVEVRGEIENLFRSVGIGGVLDAAEDSQEMSRLLKRYLKSRLDSTGLSSTSPAVLGQNRTTLAYSAMVQGGRAVNEAPKRYELGLGADIDLASCYGSKLREFSKVLGIPTVTHGVVGQEMPTLGEFLNAQGSELVEGFFTITVTGKLEFQQDLVFSKVSTIAKIRKAAGFGEEEGEGEVSRLPGDFNLIRQEIENGVVTSEILRVIRAVSNNRELKGWMGLKVVSAVVYRASDRVENLDEWVSMVGASSGVLEVVNGELADGRVKAWFPLPLAGFVEPLLAERSRLKKAMKALPNGVERDGLNSKQTLVKLLVNTLYGCFASPFFKISDAVLANNITAAARVGAWQMAKALGSYQSVTDGGIHPLAGVRFLGSGSWVKLPGFEVLADYEGWANPARGRHIGNLGGFNWTGEGLTRLQGMTTNEAERWLGEMGMTHIKSFWDAWRLEFRFDIEYKAANTFERATTHGKTDYALLTIQFQDSKALKSVPVKLKDGFYDVARLKVKCRGERFDMTKPETLAPKIKRMIETLAGSDHAPLGTHRQSKIRTIADWKASGCKGSKPGHRVEIERGLKTPVYKATHQPAKDLKVVQKRDKDKKGFDHLAGEGFKVVHKAICNQ